MSTIDNNLRFPGQYFDSETGLHQNWFREYVPRTGRFTQQDPLGLLGGLNLYGYVENRPIVSSDPLGLVGRIVCTRCKNGSGALRCRAVDDAGADFSFTCNTKGPNFPAFTGTSPAATVCDPYGPYGPIPPEIEYAVLPRVRVSKRSRFPLGTPGVTGPEMEPGSFVTPAGTPRSVVFWHGAGRTDGCFACNGNASKLVEEVMLRQRSYGGTTVIIHEVECDTCDASNPPH